MIRMRTNAHSLAYTHSTQWQQTMANKTIATANANAETPRLYFIFFLLFFFFPSLFCCECEWIRFFSLFSFSSIHTLTLEPCVHKHTHRNDKNTIKFSARWLFLSFAGAVDYYYYFVLLFCIIMITILFQPASAAAAPNEPTDSTAKWVHDELRCVCASDAFAALCLIH